MHRHPRTRPTLVAGLLLALLGTVAVAESINRAPHMAARHMVNGEVVQKLLDTTTFSGAKVNAGHVTHSANDKGLCVLTLSDDFVVPETPAPHWQLVDADGNVYLLNRLVIKDDKFNKTIIVPGYVPNVAKVQIWCAWAEALLGEAAFPEPID